MSFTTDDVTPELRNYITTTIFPEYSKNECGHQLDHITYVIRRSLNFAATVPKANPDIAYAVAAYHDIGHHIDAFHHEKVSSQIFQQDHQIQQFFTPTECQIIAEAIEDHRSSADHPPRNIYGKIVATADFTIDIDVMLRRTYAYRLRHFPNFSLEEIIEDARKHILEKYGKNGYGCDKLYFHDPEVIQALSKFQQLCSDRQKFRQRFVKTNHLEYP